MIQYFVIVYTPWRKLEINIYMYIFHCYLTRCKILNNKIPKFSKLRSKGNLLRFSYKLRLSLCLHDKYLIKYRYLMMLHKR